MNKSDIFWFGNRIEFHIENNTINYRNVELINGEQQEPNLENYKVIIAGSRKFNNYELLREKCDEFIGGRTNIEIVSGGANGADKLGERYAKERGFQLVQKAPNWALGRKAGAIRNTEMAEYAHAALIFWDSRSKGSKDMIEKCSKKIHIIKLFVIDD